MCIVSRKPRTRSGGIRGLLLKVRRKLGGRIRMRRRGKVSRLINRGVGGKWKGVYEIMLIDYVAGTPTDRAPSALIMPE